MNKNRYNKILTEVIETINEGVVFMTEKEEFNYKKRVVTDLQYWLEQFPFIHSIPEKGE